MRLKAKLRAILAGMSLVTLTPAVAKNNSVPPPSSSKIVMPVKSYAQQKQELISTYKPFLAELEGMRYNIYNDRGNPAVGWGYNFDTKNSKKYTLIEVKPKAKNGIVQLKQADMTVLASDSLSLAQKQARFPNYVLKSVSKTGAELKSIAKPAGGDSAFQGTIYVMSADTVKNLNDTRLNDFVDEVVKGVGEDTFYTWKIGRQMACIDMYYPLRSKLWTSRFYNALLKGDMTTAKAEAYASDLEKSGKRNGIMVYRRRHETRRWWLTYEDIPSSNISAAMREYKKRLPGENKLSTEMETFLKECSEKNNITIDCALVAVRGSNGLK